MKERSLVERNNNYSSFCEIKIPLLWKSLLVKNAIEPILQNEVFQYHQVTKSPDNLNSLARFYSLYEPLLLQAANIYGDSAKFVENSSKFNESFHHSARFDLCKSAIVFKGTHKLAHFDVLESCFNSLSPEKKQELLVIFIDYPKSHQKFFYENYNIKNCLCIGSISKSLKIRYHYCAFLLNKLTTLKSVTFWGIPFGMLFISKLIKKYYNNSLLLIRFLTVKHKFSFSSTYVDFLVNGAPKLAGYDYVNQSHLSLEPNFYTKNSLKLNNESKKIDFSKNTHATLLHKFKINNPNAIIVGIFARQEKISTSFLNDLNNALSSFSNSLKKHLVFAICSNNHNSIQIDPCHQVTTIKLKWAENYYNYFDFIDLFLDTYPFGGGLILAQALVRGIPSLVSTKNLLTSPSSIHAIVSRGLPYLYKLNVDDFKYISKYSFHSSSESYWSAMELLLSSSQIRQKVSKVSLLLGKASFLPESEQQSEKLAMNYFDL